MSESKTYICESNRHRLVYYDIDDNGLIYRPEKDENITLSWSDIEYIEDRSDHRVVIFLHDSTEVPIHYTTNQFPEFLKVICRRISEVRKDDFRPQKFTLDAHYLYRLRIVVCLFVLSLIISPMVSKVLFFTLLTLCIPLGIFFQRQPFSLAVGDDSLTFHYLFKETAINYDEIVNMNFEVLKNDYGKTLCIVFALKNKNRVTIKKFEDIILFFILVQIKLNSVNRGQTPFSLRS